MNQKIIFFNKAIDPYSFSFFSIIYFNALTDIVLTQKECPSASVYIVLFASTSKRVQL